MKYNQKQTQIKMIFTQLYLQTHLYNYIFEKYIYIKVEI